MIHKNNFHRDLFCNTLFTPLIIQKDFCLIKPILRTAESFTLECGTKLKSLIANLCKYTLTTRLPLHS